MGGNTEELCLLYLKKVVILFKNKFTQPRPVWLSWLEHRPVDWKVTGLILSYSICPGYRFHSRLGQVQEGNQLMFLSLPLSPSFFLSLSTLKQWQKSPWVMIKKKDHPWARTTSHIDQSISNSNWMTKIIWEKRQQLEAFSFLTHLFLVQQTAE